MRGRIHSKSHSTRKNSFLSYFFWLIIFFTIGLLIPSSPVVLALIFLTVVIMLIPLFKISTNIKYSSKKDPDTVKQEVGGENNFLVREMLPNSKMKSNEDGSYTLEFYPTWIHKWLNKKMVLHIKGESKENSFHTIFKKDDRVMLETNSRIEEKNGRTIVHEETHSKEKSGLDQLIFTNLERLETENILKKNGYNLENFEVSANFPE